MILRHQIQSDSALDKSTYMLTPRSGLYSGQPNSTLSLILQRRAESKGGIKIPAALLTRLKITKSRTFQHAWSLIP